MDINLIGLIVLSGMIFFGLFFAYRFVVHSVSHNVNQSNISMANHNFLRIITILITVWCIIFLVIIQKITSELLTIFSTLIGYLFGSWEKANKNS